MSSVGTVQKWDRADGWGVIESADTPGGCWTHFSTVEGEGFRELSVDDVVIFDWTTATNKDGHHFVATRVVRT